MRPHAGCAVIEADIPEPPVAEVREELAAPSPQRARARAYLDLFERHVLRVALIWPARDGASLGKR